MMEHVLVNSLADAEKKCQKHRVKVIFKVKS